MSNYKPEEGEATPEGRLRAYLSRTIDQSVTGSIAERMAKEAFDWAEKLFVKADKADHYLEHIGSRDNEIDNLEMEIENLKSVLEWAKEPEELRAEVKRLKRMVKSAIISSSHSLLDALPQIFGESDAEDVREEYLQDYKDSEPLWARVASLFIVGSTSGHEICEEFGFDFDTAGPVGWQEGDSP